MIRVDPARRNGIEPVAGCSPEPPDLLPGMTASPQVRQGTGVWVRGTEARTAAARIAFRFYKEALSPALHAVGWGQCRYLPTCSEYAYVAVARFGLWRGGWMAARRVLRCHPWAAGGLDPVPDR